MSPSLGVTFALGALICWGFGDFFIQKTSRSIGIWKTIFYVGLFGTVLLFPFVVPQLVQSVGDLRVWGMFLAVGLVALATALTDFRALKDGKLAIVEPIVSTEVPLTALVGVVLIQEWLGVPATILILTAFVGIVLAVSARVSARHFFERGAGWALLAAGSMAALNVATGVVSRETSPLLTIWFTHIFVGLAAYIYLRSHGKMRNTVKEFSRYRFIISATSLLDMGGWLCFAASTTAIPIAITTTISEGYVPLVVLLGIFINRERLKKHQLLGIVVAIVSIFLLSMITEQ